MRTRAAGPSDPGRAAAVAWRAAAVFFFLKAPAPGAQEGSTLNLVGSGSGGQRSWCGDEAGGARRYTREPRAVDAASCGLGSAWGMGEGESRGA